MKVAFTQDHRFYLEAENEIELKHLTEAQLPFVNILNTFKTRQFELSSHAMTDVFFMPIPEDIMSRTVLYVTTEKQEAIELCRELGYKKIACIPTGTVESVEV
jgi:hypothetical protein